MDIVSIENGDIRARTSLHGGTVLDCYYKGVPILRPCSADLNKGKFNPVQTGNFPMIPFANRVEGNCFVYKGQEYRLAANTDWDLHYLHGDAWLTDWVLEEKSEDSVLYSMRHESVNGAPYGYSATQEISVREGRLTLFMSVKNTGRLTLPFGIGQHMFFPLTEHTRLRARAKGFWGEKDGFLSDKRGEIPEDLDFNVSKELPRRWINNGYDGWDGNARIIWLERALALDIRACFPVEMVAGKGVTMEGEPMQRFFLFRSDRTFEPDFADDYFCFEPMSHDANGHRLSGLGGLCELAPSESLCSLVTLQPVPLH